VSDEEELHDVSMVLQTLNTTDLSIHRSYNGPDDLFEDGEYTPSSRMADTMFRHLKPNLTLAKSQMTGFTRLHLADIDLRLSASTWFTRIDFSSLQTLSLEYRCRSVKFLKQLRQLDPSPSLQALTIVQSIQDRDNDLDRTVSELNKVLQMRPGGLRELSVSLQNADRARLPSPSAVNAHRQTLTHMVIDVTGHVLNVEDEISMLYSDRDLERLLQGCDKVSQLGLRMRMPALNYIEFDGRNNGEEHTKFLEQWVRASHGIGA
jgi:hypothetical protein